MKNTTQFYQTPSIRIRLTMVILAFGFIGLCMLGRSTWIQIIGDTKLENLAKRQFQSKFLIKPRRGLITDRAGEPLAINLETSSLAGNPSKIIQSRSTLHLLSRALGVSVPSLKKSLNAKKSFVWLERHVTEERMDKFRRYGIIFSTPTGAEDMPEGLWIVKEMKRIYPHADMAAPLIGTVNVDAEGLEGVELWKNTSLQGKSASVEAIKDALGRPALLNNSNAAKIEDGKNIELSMDASLQFSVEEELRDAVAKTRSQAGLAIVMDSNTGEILALAQNPSFNPNQRGSNSMNRKLKALTDGYEPGSTIKPLLLSSAVSAGIHTRDLFFGHYGKFKVQGRTISEAEAHEKFGMISLKKMLEVSSNVVAAELALKIGADRYVSTLRDLGFGQKTGTQFPGEISGWLPTAPKSIKPLSLANMGFGQGMFVTPMQMLRSYAALANGGYLVEPTLLKLKDNESVRRVPALRSQVVKEVTQAMIGVTEGEQGTGKTARVDGYKIAGKTGTAQTVDAHTKKYSNSRYIASFIGFPVGTKQSFTILTLLDHPKGVYFASQTAAPLFAAVLKQVMSRYSIPATEPIAQPLTQYSATPAAPPEVVAAVPPAPAEPVAQNQSAFPMLSKAAQAILGKSLPEKPVVERIVSSEAIPGETGYAENIKQELMPTVLGLTPQEAMGTLKSFSPRIQIHGFGIIRKQVPESGAPLRVGEKVTLYLGE